MQARGSRCKAPTKRGSINSNGYGTQYSPRGLKAALTPARRAASVVIKMDDTSCVEVEAPTLRGEAIAERRQPRRTVVPSQVLATGVIVCMFACSSAAPRLFALRTTLLHLRLDATAGCCWTHLECLANDMCFGPKPAAGDELNNQWVRRQHVHICARSPFG